MGITPAGVNQTPPAGDQANAVVEGAFAAIGVSPTFYPYGPFNILIYGPGGLNQNWNGTVRLERTFDGGTTWIICGIGGAGQQAVWNTPNQDVSVVAAEPERGVGYRLNCVVLGAGPVNYRMSQSGQAAMSLAVATPI
jgi:hypothetical protein